MSPESPTAGTMRAAFLEGPRTLAVRDAPIPEPGPGDVRLRVSFCGICGSDLSLFKTGALAGPDTVLGHETAGTVVDSDPAGAWARGTRVTYFPGRGCGECVWCREGKFRYCLNPPLPRGAFAEYVTVSAEQLLVIPGNVDDRAAALAEPLGVALRGVSIAEARAGDLAYVSGLGSIGLLAAAGLAEAGCRVVGGDPRENRRALGLELGCHAVLDPTTEDPGRATVALDPHGPRIVFECAGVPESLQQAIDTCGFGGVVGILGIPMAPAFLLPMTLKEQRAFSIQGPSFWSLRRALDMLHKRPQVAKIITATVPLAQIGAAFEGLVEGDGNVKVLVEPGA